MTLARTVARTVDVDAMLSRMEPRQFDEWREMYHLEPWGEEWRRTGTIAAEVANGFQLIAASFTGGKPEQIKPEDYYRPSERQHAEVDQRYLTPEQSLRKNRMLCGV